MEHLSECDRTKFFWYRYRYFFLGRKFSGSGTFFGTKFFRYRYQYHPKRSKIPGTGMSHSGTCTFQKKIFGIYRILRIDTIALVSKFEYKLQHALLSSWSIIITSSLQLTLIVILGHNGSND